MNTRVFVVGVVLLVAGFALFWYGYQTVQELSSNLGILGRILSSEVQERYEIAKYAEIGGGGLALTGLAVTVYGIVTNSKPK